MISLLFYEGIHCKIIAFIGLEVMSEKAVWHMLNCNTTHSRKRAVSNKTTNNVVQFVCPLFIT